MINPVRRWYAACDRATLLADLRKLSLGYVQAGTVAVIVDSALPGAAHDSEGGKMNVENLKKLAAVLRSSLPIAFDMSNFLENAEGDSHNPNELDCGTAACAIGISALAVQAPLPSEYDWWEYSERVYGIASHPEEWNWLFSAQWKHTDNTPEGVAARIDWLIEHGLPWNWQEQMLCQAPLCYKAKP